MSRKWYAPVGVKAALISGSCAVVAALIALFGVVWVHSAKDSPAPPETRNVPSPTPGPADLSLSISPVKHKDGVISALESGDVLTSSDHYAIRFVPTIDAYVYILQQDVTLQYDVLFPNPDWSKQQNPVAASAEVWVPVDRSHWFWLDENVGPESLLIVASRRPVESLEQLARSGEGPSGGQDAGGQEVPSWLSGPDRGVKGVRRLAEKTLAVPGESIPVLVDHLLVTSEDPLFLYRLQFDHR